MEWLWLAGAALVGLIWWFASDRRYPYAERATIISQAMNGSQDIRIVYWAKTTRKWSTRTVTPLALDGTYVRAFDHSRQAERTFKVTRIKEVLIVALAAER